MASGKQIAFRRLARDIKVVQKDNLDAQGIYISVDPFNAFHVRSLIIGPSDTPYQYGNYFFDLCFPEEHYPHKPPQVTFQTRSGDMRFNPNLYANGKVCVSLLNTWAGPQWTSCQSLKSILLSFQTLLHEMPLQNEPGYENVKSTDEFNMLYNDIVTHENYRTAIIHMFDSPPPGFEVFLPVMRDCFVQNAPMMLKDLAQRCTATPCKKKCRVYGMTSAINYKEQHSNIANMALLMNYTSMDASESGPKSSADAPTSSPKESAVLDSALDSAPGSHPAIIPASSPSYNSTVDENVAGGALSAPAPEDANMHEQMVLMESLSPMDSDTETTATAPTNECSPPGSNPDCAVESIAGDGSLSAAEFMLAPPPSLLPLPPPSLLPLPPPPLPPTPPLLPPPPSLTADVETPTPPAKKKRMYNINRRPAKKARGFSIGYTESVLDEKKGHICVWCVSEDKRGAKRWKLVSKQALTTV